MERESDRQQRQQPDEVSEVVAAYLEMTSPWHRWMRESAKKVKTTLDNDGLSLEEGNDLA